MVIKTVHRLAYKPLLPILGHLQENKTPTSFNYLKMLEVCVYSHLMPTSLITNS